MKNFLFLEMYLNESTPASDTENSLVTTTPDSTKGNLTLVNQNRLL